MSNRVRLDAALVARGLVPTRSQAEKYTHLGRVLVNGNIVTDPEASIRDGDHLALAGGEQYVSRAGLKLASVAEAFALDFMGKIVLDVGSSTGGFTDYALQHGARTVIAVDKGTDQLHPLLRNNPAVELHEKTDIRCLMLAGEAGMMNGERRAEKGGSDYLSHVVLDAAPDIILVDVSFVSLREILPHVSGLMARDSILVAMVKPQFEAVPRGLSDGVVKNDRIRRDILKAFEAWAAKRFVVEAKADSEVPGTKGNRERFYILRRLDVGKL